VHHTYPPRHLYLPQIFLLSAGFSSSAESTGGGEAKKVTKIPRWPVAKYKQTDIKIAAAKQKRKKYPWKNKPSRQVNDTNHSVHNAKSHHRQTMSLFSLTWNDTLTLLHAVNAFQPEMFCLPTLGSDRKS